MIDGAPNVWPEGYDRTEAEQELWDRLTWEQQQDERAEEEDEQE